MLILSRYEVARLVGLRALQLSEGVTPHVQVDDPTLRSDFVYVAALELYEKKMDACVMRVDGVHHVTAALLPPDLATLLNSRDASTRTH